MKKILLTIGVLISLVTINSQAAGPSSEYLTRGGITCRLAQVNISYSVGYGELTIYDDSGKVYRDHDDGYEAVKTLSDRMGGPNVISIVHHEEQIPEIQFSIKPGPEMGKGWVNTIGYVNGGSSQVIIFGEAKCSYSEKDPGRS